MAIKVSYLASGLYPPWFKTGAESVPAAGEWKSIKPDPGPFNMEHPTIKPWGPGPFQLPTVKPDKGPFPFQHPGISRDPGPFDYKPPPVTGEMVPTINNIHRSPSPKNDPWAEIGQLYFNISVQGQDLGYWAKIDGLGMKVEMAEHRTGDGFNYRWIEPTISSFTNIKLSRAASAKGCRQSISWLMHAQYAWKKGMTATIVAKPLWHYATEESFFKVSIADVMPVAWTGPNFATDGKLAMETLELAYSGFMPPAPAEPMLTTPPPYDGRKDPLPVERMAKRVFDTAYVGPVAKTTYLAGLEK